MGFDSAPMLIFGFCLIIVIAGSLILLRTQWLMQWLKGSAGLLLIGLAVYFSLFALNLFSYHQLSRDTAMATVSFRQLGPQSYVATLSQPGSDSVDYQIDGDLWQLDARIIRWKGVFALLGFQPGYQFDGIRSRPVKADDFVYYDLILAMDKQNLADLTERCPAEQQHKLRLLMSYHPDFKKHQEVPDPYYGGSKGFELVLKLIEQSCQQLLRQLTQQSASLAESREESL